MRYFCRMVKSYSIWISLILIVPSLYIHINGDEEVSLDPLLTNPASDDEKFDDLYGNVYNTSGIWEAVRKVSSDQGRLMNISRQAHISAGFKKTDVLGRAWFETNSTLTFGCPRFKPILVDTIVYTVTRLPSTYLYLSKGLAPDCIFHLISRVSSWISIILVFPSPRVIARTDEDIWVSLYGNDVNTSGIWQEVRDIACDEEKLKNISFQAHEYIWTHHIKIETAVLESKILTFPVYMNNVYKDINADVLIYTLHGVPDVHFYLTKGLSPDCVFYLLKIGWGEAKEFQFKNQACGITIPK